MKYSQHRLSENFTGGIGSGQYSRVYNWGEPERSPTLLSSMHSAVYVYSTSRLLRMRQMFHVKHGVDAPPTTCMRAPKRKRLRNRCFATATDINGCSVARSIEVTMVGTLDRSRLPRSAIMAAQVQY